MASIKDNELLEIKRLYKQGFSAREIADKYSNTIDAVYYFFKRHNIPRRNAREQNLVRFSRKLPSFLLDNNKTKKLHYKKLKYIGIMLYWCEGSQWPGEQQVDFANSNPEMIKIFVRFLREICGIDNHRLRVYLYCYSNQNPSKLLKFWSDLIKIPRKQFTKPYIRKDFKPEKIGKMKYGLIHIRYGDKKLLFLLKNWIGEVIKEYSC